MIKKILGKIGLQAKIVGLATITVVLAILVTQIIATYGMRKLSIDTALTMGARALYGYVLYLESRMDQVHGQLRLIGNQLVDEWGGSIAADFRSYHFCPGGKRFSQGEHQHYRRAREPGRGHMDGDGQSRSGTVAGGR